MPAFMLGFQQKTKEGLASIVNERTVAGVMKFACTCFSLMNREIVDTHFSMFF